MANVKEWILELAKDEEIEAVVIGEMGWGSYGKESVPGYDEMPKGVVLSWADASRYLDYDFNSEYGAPGCQAVYAWTKSLVITIGQYDGATWPYAIPRNPTDIMPEMQGG